MNRYQAEELAIHAHKDQVDLCGEPYILHPAAVAKAVQSYPGCEEIHVVTAWLHDVIEDTVIHVIDNFSEREIEAIQAISRGKTEPYKDYIFRLCDDPVASIVKLADLWHNLSPARMEQLPERQQKSLTERYLEARDQIWRANRTEWWPGEIRGKSG